MAQPKWRQAMTTDERHRYWQTQIDNWQQSGTENRVGFILRQEDYGNKKTAIRKNEAPRL